MEEKKEQKNIYQKLSDIQNELKVPKGQKNTFGNYKYRSCEDILEEAKPICKKHGTVVLLTDELVYMGDRYYVKATAGLFDLNGENKIYNTAYAREEETKKGMDGSQITGTASSYARKYALNGLFNIDDTKDADTDEYAKENKNEEKKEESKASDKQVKMMEDLKVNIEAVKKVYGVEKFEDLTVGQASEVISKKKEGK